MIENLKALRSVHQILMAVCAAIFVFVLVPNLRPRLLASQEELYILRDLATSNYYPSFVSQHIQSNEDADNQMVERALKKAGVRITDNPHFKEPIFCDTCGSMGHELRSYEALFHELQRAQSTRLKATSETIEKQIAKSVPPLSLDQSVADIQFLNLDSSMTLSGRTTILSAEPSPNFNRGRLDFVLRSDKGIPAPAKSLVVTFIPDQTISGYFFKEWLLQDAAGKKLIGMDHDNEVFMPASREFWAEIQAMTPNDAIKLIQSKDDAAKNKLSFLGLSVDRSAASWISPLVATLVLLYLIAHLRHVTQFAVSLNEKQAALAFPWVGVFKGWVGTLVAYISVCALPFVATWWLYFHSRETASSFDLLALFLTLAVTACSLWAARELHKFRTYVRSDSIRESTSESDDESKSDIDELQSKIEN